MFLVRDKRKFCSTKRYRTKFHEQSFVLPELARREGVNVAIARVLRKLEAEVVYVMLHGRFVRTLLFLRWFVGFALTPLPAERRQ